MCSGCNSTPDLDGPISPEVAAERVDLGFEFLDSEYGPDWVYRVDTTVLDIRSSKNCVGGQLEGHFSDFQAEHIFYGRDVVSRGFDTFSATFSDTDNLTKAWIDKINARKLKLES